MLPNKEIMEKIDHEARALPDINKQVDNNNNNMVLIRFEDLMLTLLKIWSLFDLLMMRKRRGD